MSAGIDDECMCECHTMPGVMHLVPCCDRPPATEGPPGAEPMGDRCAGCGKRGILLPPDMMCRGCLAKRAAREFLTDAGVQKLSLDGYHPERTLAREVMRLRSSIRSHRDERGHNRCRLDDDALYALLPEGAAGADTALPPRDEFLRGCERFWELRRKLPRDEAEAEARRLTAAGTLGEPDTDEFYIENTDHNFDFRLWWGPNGAGYTTILEQAGLYTEDRARAQERDRPSDIARRKSDVDAAAAGRVVSRRAPLPRLDDDASMEGA